jgi:alpha-tubulin suppressor-like RCC1 family protein
VFHSNQDTWTLRASVTTVLCAALLTTGAMAANVTLQTIDVTPTAKAISVGQKQSFTATGTLSNGSRQVLGPAISDIGLGYATTCALLTSGGVECWGYNGQGQLGNGTTTESLIPVPVKRMHTAAALVLGGSHGCALLNGGAVECWGRASYGDLGDGGSTSRHHPVSVVGISTATALALNSNNSCALLASGALQCWGRNLAGELGDGSGETESDIPVFVSGISTATAIAVGYEHSCAVLRSGSVQCWGGNDDGELGIGVTGGGVYATPVTVSGISSATSVATGGDATCALLASGAVKCWGYNYFGQLGDGSNAESNVPVPVSGISTAIAVTGGLQHFCAILRSGSVQCWGDNEFGQLGNGKTANSNLPVFVQAIKSPTKLVAGANHTCALFSGGVMRCWGNDSNGQLGDRRKTDYSTPTPLAVTVVGTPGVVWTSSNTSKATITDRGVATGRAAGNTTITATTPGSINDNAVLTVK